MIIRNKNLFGTFLLFLPFVFYGCKEDNVATSYCKNSESTSTNKPIVEKPNSLGDAGNNDSEASYDENDYTGLYCFEYGIVNNTLHINIVNYWADCQGPFTVELKEKTSNSISISILPQSCAASGCLCPYDFPLSFSDINFQEDISFKVRRYSCLTGNVESSYDALLSLKEESYGIICQYFGQTVGKRHSFCKENQSCDEGLECTEVDTLIGKASICLLKCEEISDCPVTGGFTCEEGVCKVKDSMKENIL